MLCFFAFKEDWKMPIDAHEQNRKSWNHATRQHHTHRTDLIERYRNGHNNLFTEDIALLGDVRGKRVVHLQCNDGQDTVSIARLGADVVGVDISDEAIDFARRLAMETDLKAEFVRSDIFDWCETTDETFDVVYTSYGVLYWLSDLGRWGKGISKVLKPNGKLVLVEFHPVQNMYELDWSIGYPYMGGSKIDAGGVGDYVGDDYEGSFQNPETAYEYPFGMGDVVTALLEAGLRLTHMREYNYMNGWKRFPEMIEKEGRRNYLPEEKATLPLMFSVVAEKPAII
jgi:SAM-dependent methyltransferase